MSKATTSWLHRPHGAPEASAGPRCRGKQETSRSTLSPIRLSLSPLPRRREPPSRRQCKTGCKACLATWWREEEGAGNKAPTGALPPGGKQGRRIWSSGVCECTQAHTRVQTHYQPQLLTTRTHSSAWLPALRGQNMKDIATEGMTLVLEDSQSSGGETEFIYMKG